MAKTPAAPKCTEAGCGHVTDGHDKRIGCRALKNVKPNRPPTHCPCTRSYPHA